MECTTWQREAHQINRARIEHVPQRCPPSQYTREELSGRFQIEEILSRQNAESSWILIA
jgi:hypothetical protein